MTSARLETANKFLSHFNFLDPEILREVLAEDYTHDYTPASLPLPSFDKAGLIDFVSNLKTVMRGYPPTVKAILESESSNAVTVWMTAQADFRDEVKEGGSSDEAWEYTGEYMLLLYLNAAGDRIAKTVEFFDSKATSEKMFALVGKAQAKLAKTG
jgi:hypothetical protein